MTYAKLEPGKPDISLAASAETQKKNQSDDTDRTQQKSHGSKQNRSKKEGHATQIGSGQDQQSSRTESPDPARTKR